MTFLNPLGLLGLLAIPAILALHFLRSQRREKVIGGLHLWAFAREKEPVGARWQRLENTALLFVHLLAALVATLLLAGLDWNTGSPNRHLVAVIDGSASMGATTSAGGETAYEEAFDEIRDELNAGDQVTVIEAGTTPRIIAGPFARRDEAFAALDEWRPLSPSADLFEAVRFGRRFCEPSQSLLLLTDHSPELVDLEAPPAGVLWRALGDVAPNSAISYAERRRVEPNLDRVFLSLDHYGTTSSEVSLAIVLGSRVFANQTLEVAPGESRQFEFDVEDPTAIVTLRLADDALAADNIVRLAPTPPRLVSWTIHDGNRAAARALERALGATYDAYRAPSDEDAMLVFSEAPIADHRAAAGALLTRYPAARAFVMLPTFTEDAKLSVAEDLFLPGREAGPALRGLGFEGVQWAYSPEIVATPGDLLSHGGHRLIARERLASGASMWSFNLALSASSLPRTTAWPLIIDDLVEQVRRDLPGPRYFNFAAGESLPISAAGVPPVPWILTGPNGAERRFDRLPPVLSELSPGVHRIAPDIAIEGDDSDGARRPGWTVAANLFAPDESNLLDRSRAEVEMEKAWQTGEAEETRRPIAYYSLLAMLLILLVAWWMLTRQDRGPRGTRTVAFATNAGMAMPAASRGGGAR